MKKIEINEEDLEMMNYNDIAHVLLEQNGKKMKIIDLFHEVGKVLNLEEAEYESYITDFFELLSTDKRFIMLEDGYWDLSIKHNKGMVMENEEDDDEDVLIEDDDNSEDIYEECDEDKDIDDDVEDDDLSDLVIIDDREEDNL